RIKVDTDKCIGCNACVDTCLMDIKKVGDHECIQCGSCIELCPIDIIYFNVSKNKSN
ncbi:MAG: 4Fe-4S binding protein, partial [Eubacterium sp.]|nr:4Fe-4S binding protein [Eubacterium sp.]